MKPLRKKLLIAAVASLGLTTIAIANPWGGPGPMMGGGPGDCPMMGGGPGRGHGRMGGDPGQRMAMMQQFHAERMELLEARLKLKPEQQASWKAFLAAQDAHHDAMQKNRQEMRDKDETALAHFEEMAQNMEQNLASMKAMVKAASDLYATLDPTQKKVMDDFFTDRPMHRMMRGQLGQPTPPVSPAQQAQ
ncbi:MAG TPA: Spy/CpxP family protein refolding chaperone [Candidatus Competibacter sp.]|nr:Spy/CpxP family protein refolding chaperone [Candidatus Competibacter sp.]